MRRSIPSSSSRETRRLLQVILQPVGVVDAIEKTWRPALFAEIGSEQVIDAGVEFQKPYIRAVAVSSFGVMRGGGGQRGPGTQACERGADGTRIGGVFEPPTQFPQDLPRARSIATAGLAPIEFSLYGSDFVIC